MSNNVNSSCVWPSGRRQLERSQPSGQTERGGETGRAMDRKSNLSGCARRKAARKSVATCARAAARAIAASRPQVYKSQSGAGSRAGGGLSPARRQTTAGQGARGLLATKSKSKSKSQSKTKTKARVVVLVAAAKGQSAQSAGLELIFGRQINKFKSIRPPVRLLPNWPLANRLICQASPSSREAINMALRMPQWDAPTSVAPNVGDLAWACVWPKKLGPWKSFTLLRGGAKCVQFSPVCHCFRATTNGAIKRDRVGEVRNLVQVVCQVSGNHLGEFRPLLLPPAPCLVVW